MSPIPPGKKTAEKARLANPEIGSIPKYLSGLRFAESCRQTTVSVQLRIKG